jgi:hypothetical protein
MKHPPMINKDFLFFALFFIIVVLGVHVIFIKVLTIYHS